MNKKIISLIILLTIPFFTFSQDVIFAQKVKCLPVPEILNTYPYAKFIQHINEDVKKIENHLESSSNMVWEVYSDRDDNIVYDDSYGDPIEGRGGKVNYMDRFFVHKVDGNWLNLVTLKTSFGSHTIDKNIGWVHASKIILSKFPILSSTGAPTKKMILITGSDLPEDFRKKSNFDIFEDKHYYNNPTLVDGEFQNKYKRNLKAGKLQILYVMKQDENANSVLLSSSDKIQNTTDVLGWYLNLKTTSWDTRVCLEPLSGRKITSYFTRDKNGLFPSNYVFRSPYDLQTYQQNSENIDISRVVRKIQLKKKRMVGQSMRYPVMDWEENSTIRKNIAVIAEMGDPNDGSDCNLECQQANALQELDSIKSLSNNVNVLIVIDGTESMEKYGPVVGKAISQIINERKLDGKQDLKWGLAVYRDYDDGNKLFELNKLTDNEKLIVNRLKNIKYHSDDAGHSESHYYGMTEAIKRAGFVKGQSNIIVLVGDAGNHLNDRDNLNSKSVINLLTNKNINLISFQTNFVTGKEGRVYHKFSKDSREYILGTAKNYLKKIKNNDGLNVKLLEGNVPYSYQLGYSGFASEETKPSFGFFNHAVQGDDMPVSNFKRNLVNTFLNYMTQLDDRSELLRCIIDGNCAKKTGNTFDQKKEDLCRLYGFSAALCDALAREGEISLSGYTPMKIGGKPAYSEVAYISMEYKEILNERLNDLSFVNGSGKKARDQFYETMISLIHGLIGVDIDESGEIQEGSFDHEIISKWTFDKTWEVLLGVSFSNNSPLNNKKIEDLLTDNISDEDFEEFLFNFKLQIEDFITFPTPKDLRTSVFKNGSQTFYWIPFSKIPRGENE